MKTANQRCRSWRGFTLVELLVVIGIIALLISILLPALNRARRSANAVKCATQLREIGNAFKFYAIDNKNYYPPAQINSGSATIKYQIDGNDYPVQVGANWYGAYWFNFLNKYVTKNTAGINGADRNNQADVRRSVLWGCTAFEGYRPTTGTDPAFDVNPVQTGFCMNGYPTFDTNYPAVTLGNVFPPQAERSWDGAWAPGNPGSFIKANIWGKHSSSRMLIADGKIWLGDSGFVALNRTDKTVPTQNSGDENKARESNETNISLWRHSKMPSAKEGNYYNPNRSTVAFNVLYVDGHVTTENSPKMAYMVTRMRYPG